MSHFVPIVVGRLDSEPLFGDFAVHGTDPYAYLKFEKNVCFLITPSWKSKNSKDWKKVFDTLDRSKQGVVSGEHVRLEWDGKNHHLWIDESKTRIKGVNPWIDVLAPIFDF